ncbi:hypothetical protein BC567DRAFT_41984 [Phyllosticta citribraziliensis]
MATPHHKSPEADAELERKLQENAKLTQESQQRLSDTMKKRARGRSRRRRRRGSDASWNEDEYQKTKKRRADAWTAMVQDMEAKAMRDEERERRGEKATDIVDLEMLEVVEDHGHLSSLPESDLRDNDWDKDNSEGDPLGQDDDDDDDDDDEDEDDDASSDSMDQLCVQRVQTSRKKKASQRQPSLPSDSGSDYDYDSGSGSDSPAADDSPPKADNPEQQTHTSNINTKAKTNTPTTTSRRRPWTAQDTALLMELADQGVPYAALATQFGRTYMTIVARIRYVKDRPAERQSYQTWTSEDNALLLLLRAEKLNYKEIARRLGRTEAQAAAQHKRLTAKENIHGHA